MDWFTIVVTVIAAISAIGIAHSVASTGAMESLARSREPVRDQWHGHSRVPARGRYFAHAVVAGRLMYRCAHFGGRRLGLHEISTPSSVVGA